MIQQITTLISRAIIWLLVTFTIPAQCLWNHRYGERALTLWRIAISNIMIPVIGLPLLAPVRFDLPRLTERLFTDWSLEVVSVRAFLVIIMLWHWIDIQARKSRGEVWHSKSLGIPWRWLGTDGKTQRLFIQPALTVALGEFFWISHNPPIASYFFVAAVLQLAGWWMIYHSVRGRLLDAVDQQIEAGNLRTLGEGREPQTRKGDPLEQVLTPAERNNAPDLAEILSKYQQ
jgi:hypothetical protein